MSTAQQLLVVTNHIKYGSDPITVTCFNCKKIVVTRTVESINGCCCCVFGCWALCCPGCRDVEHTCPKCNVILGNFKAS